MIKGYFSPPKQLRRLDTGRREVGNGAVAGAQRRDGATRTHAAVPLQRAREAISDLVRGLRFGSRNDWRQADLSQLAVIDPQNLLRMLRARIETNARGLLLVQTPIS